MITYLRGKCVIEQTSYFSHYVTIPSGGIPLHVGAHEVLVGAHAGEVAGVDELEHAVHAPQAGQHDKLPGGRPEQVVGGLPLVLLQDLGLCALLEAVERDVEGLCVTVDDAELVADRLKITFVKKYI